jgi:hypothetical protein
VERGSVGNEAQAAVGAWDGVQKAHEEGTKGDPAMRGAKCVAEGRRGLGIASPRTARFHAPELVAHHTADRHHAARRVGPHGYSALFRREAMSVGPTTLDTVRRALRHPGTWLLAGLALFTAWCGLGLSILALGDASSQTRGLIVATSQSFGALSALWTLSIVLEQDTVSGLALALDCTAPGPQGRILGRWAGATVIGASTGLALQLALQTATRTSTPGSLYLYSANIIGPAQVAAWGLLLSAIARGPHVLLPGLMLWLVGHLPWGSPELLPGWGGHVVASLLPASWTPDRPGTVLGASLLATLGLLCLAAAWTAAPRGACPPANSAPARRSPTQTAG